MTMAKTRALVSADSALGAVGCGLASVSAAFGLYMVVHGPAPGSLGAGKDFTVFAQLAPRARRPEPPEPDAQAQAQADEGLDMTATGSIPHRARTHRDARAPGETVIASAVLQSADADEATVTVYGRALVVHVGDMVPGAGEVLKITPGAHPRVVTSRGLIEAAPE